MAVKTNLSSLLTSADLSAYFLKYAAEIKSDDKYFRTVEHKGDNWGTIGLQGAQTNLAAGLISSNASAPVLSRPSVQSVIGSFLEFGGAFDMSSDDIQQFFDLKQAFASSGNQGDAVALLDFYGGDVARCRSIIQNEKMFLNWNLLSNACNIDITLANSTYGKSMTSTSYPLESWNKDVVATTWSNIASLIVDDIVEAVELGKTKQKKYTRMFVNPTTFNYIRKNTQVQNLCASRISVVLSSVGMPSLDTINMMFNELCGITIVVISDYIDRESVAGIVTTGYAFNDNVVVFSESDALGHFGYKSIAIIDPSVEARQGYFIIGNSLETNPSKSTTYSKCKGFSVIDSYASNLYLKIDANAWA